MSTFLLVTATILPLATTLRVNTPCMALGGKKSSNVKLISDLEEFEHEVNAPAGPLLSVVRFTAQRCRGCIAMDPKFASLARKHKNEANFYEVKEDGGRVIFGQERVVRTPTVLYYCGDIGRVSGFPFGETPAEGSFLRDEYKRVASRMASLREVRRSALRPAMRYKSLVGMLRALVRAESLLEEEEKARPQRERMAKAEAERAAASGAAPSEAEAAAAAEKELVRTRAIREASALFEWIVGDSSGLLTSSDIDRCVEAIGGRAVITGRVGAGGSSGLYFADASTPPDGSEAKAFTDLIEGLHRALQVAAGGSSSDGLGLDDFTSLIVLHRNYERSKLKPDAEARAAYALLDAEGTGGKVPIERAASRIAGMTEVLPLPGLEAESSPDALGQLLTTFDLEEEGCASFKSFARIVMRSSPSAW